MRAWQDELVFGYLANLLPNDVQTVLVWIFCVAAFAGLTWFVTFGSRKPAPTERSESFRKPERMTALGCLLVLGDMIFVLSQPDTAAGWEAVLALIWFAAGIGVACAGYRQTSRAAAAFPGKHAGRPSRGTWQRRTRR